MDGSVTTFVSDNLSHRAVITDSDGNRHTITVQSTYAFPTAEELDYIDELAHWPVYVSNTNWFAPTRKWVPYEVFIDPGLCYPGAGHEKSLQTLDRKSNPEWFP